MNKYIEERTFFENIDLRGADRNIRIMDNTLKKSQELKESIFNQSSNDLGTTTTSFKIKE